MRSSRNFAAKALTSMTWVADHVPLLGSKLSPFSKIKTCADSGPDVFNDFYFNNSSLICLKLWRRDGFVVLPRIRHGVFVPRYARKLFFDH